MSRRRSDDEAKSDARIANSKDRRGKTSTIPTAPDTRKKPARKRNKKSIAITPEAYNELTQCARDEGIDRKALASHAILAYRTTNQESSPENKKPNLKDRFKQVAERYLDRLEKRIDDDDTFEPTVQEFGQIVRTMKDLDGLTSETSSESSILAKWNELESRLDTLAGATDKK